MQCWVDFFNGKIDGDELSARMDLRLEKDGVQTTRFKVATEKTQAPTESYLLKREHLIRLCRSVLERKLEPVEASYIADSIDVQTHLFEDRWELADKLVSDVLSWIGTPEVHGELSDDTLKSYIEQLGA